MARTKGPASFNTKQRLSDAALDQFHRKGYNGTSVQDLVTAAGAPKGTFYNHFASKEDLALEAVRRYAGELGVVALADSSAGSPLERIRRHFAGLVASGLEVAAERGCLIGNLAGEVPAHSPVVAAAIGTYFDTWVAALSRAIEEAKQAGEIATDIPAEDLAEFLVNAWEGGAVHAKTTASVNPVRTFERMVVHLLR
jgi:TetR/AcrR family transcriptional repressor of nem operon